MMLDVFCGQCKLARGAVVDVVDLADRAAQTGVLRVALGGSCTVVGDAGHPIVASRAQETLTETIDRIEETTCR